MFYIDGKRAPDFLYIGAAKAGSSWIFEILTDHPNIFLPRAKDVQFFDHQYDKGLDWYLGFFKDSAQAKAIGEISHDYFLSELYAERIHQAVPNVKLIACLREPVSRTVSMYTYARSAFLKKGTKFEEYAFRDDVLRGSAYYTNLKPFYDRFDRRSILVKFYDEIEAEPEKFCRQLFEFIEVDPEFEPAALRSRVRVARAARSEHLAHWAWAMAKWLRRRGLANVVGGIKRSPFYNRAMYGGARTQPVVSEDTRRVLVDHFSVDYPALERLIGRTLPESWPRSGQGDADAHRSRTARG